MWSDWETKGSSDDKITEEVSRPTEDQVSFAYLHFEQYCNDVVLVVQFTRKVLRFATHT